MAACIHCHIHHTHKTKRKACTPPSTHTHNPLTVARGRLNAHTHARARARTHTHTHTHTSPAHPPQRRVHNKAVRERHVGQAGHGDGLVTHERLHKGEGWGGVYDGKGVGGGWLSSWFNPSKSSNQGHVQQNPQGRLVTERGLVSSSERIVVCVYACALMCVSVHACDTAGSLSHKPDMGWAVCIVVCGCACASAGRAHQHNHPQAQAHN